ncbi:enoyl-CoA hydratase/isomerase family protein [Seongchinamella sediminis]|nr:enoyl-CoA hydratase/isomerase family protein [Seongchinamella sediminis]
MSDLIRIERDDKLLTLVLNRPERKNALSIALLEAFCKALYEEVTVQTVAVIICGEGGCFSAGADLSDLNGTLDDLAVDDAVAAAVQAINDTPVPVIAAIDGPCVGAAVDFCLACDVRVASAGAFIQIPAARLGLLYNPAAVARVARSVAPDILFRLLVLGERFLAEEAARVGLLSYPIANGGSREAAVAIARAGAGNVPLAVAASKGLLNALQDGSYDPESWNEKRRNILESPERRAAVESAKKR